MKLLMHICCAPCANMPIDALRAERVELTGYWYNPNIHPFTEYRARRNCLQEYAKTIDLPLIVLLAGQTLFMILYVVLVVFNIMGRDYDAAVIVSGTCGFGMGATPNAMANMQAICDKYSPSVKAYLLIPLVGSLFADFLNSLVITVFINFI